MGLAETLLVRRGLAVSQLVLNTLSYSIRFKVDSNKIKERNNINYYNSVCGA